MNTWKDLSMAEKADIMKLAIEDGIYDLNAIKKGYNEFAEGGKKNQNTWTMEDEAKYREWRSSLPANLRNTDDNLYDMRGAYKAGMKPTLESDGRYHLQSRDPKTGRILKSPLHPTYLKAIATDASMGYYPTVDNQGNTYTQTWEGNQYKKGGSIHIKPSKRGTFTAAASKHGMGVQEFASKVLANKDDYSSAMVKKANFARNASKWKHGEGGNIYGDGGVLDFIKSLWGGDSKTAKRTVYRAVDGSVHNTEKEATQRNRNLVHEGKAYFQRGNSIMGINTKIVPRNPNTSSTSAKSTSLENKMYRKLDQYRTRVGFRTKDYDIPYGSREIRVLPKGSTLPINISVNALDSVAKYAGVTGLPIEEALGLPMQETVFGKHPHINYQSLDEGYTSKDLGNANYFKNFGSIPAEYLVRDFRYNGDLSFNGKHSDPIPLDTPPLQHAFEYYIAGLYNTNDPNHTKDVQKAGAALWDETTGSLRNWWETEGKEWYNKGTKQQKKK